MTTDELDRTALAAMNTITQQVIDGELRGVEAKERLHRASKIVAEQRSTLSMRVRPLTRGEAFKIAFVGSLK